MVSNWSLSDSKSPQVSWTFLCILTDLNNAVVWMVSNHPLISRSSSPCTNHLVTVPSAPITIGITTTFMIHNFFSSLARSRYLFLFSLSCSFTLWSTGTAKFTIRQVLFFCYHYVWSTGRGEVIRLYFKIPNNFVRLIFLDGFWVVHIKFVRMVKLKLLAQFSVDHLAHTVMSSLIISSS